MQEEEQETIAVLLAVYNGERYLDDFLNSLEEQTDHGFVCAVRDDGSTDRSMDIVRKHQKRYPEFYRIYTCDNPYGRSAKGNFFTLMSCVRAKYYMFADQDDVWLPDKIAVTRKAMQRIRGRDGELPIAVFSDLYVTDEHLKVLSDSFIRSIDRDPEAVSPNELLIDNPAAGCSMMINRPLRDRALTVRDLSNLEEHDGWLMLLASVFGTVQYIDRPLAYYRQHGDNEKGAGRRSIPARILQNIRLIGTGKFRKEKRAFIREKQNLASELLQQDGLSPEYRRVLKGFIDLDEMPKRQRIDFLKTHHFQRAHHNFWFRFFA